MDNDSLVGQVVNTIVSSALRADDKDSDQDAYNEGLRGDPIPVLDKHVSGINEQALSDNNLHGGFKMDIFLRNVHEELQYNPIQVVITDEKAYQRWLRYRNAGTELFGRVGLTYEDELAKGGDMN